MITCITDVRAELGESPVWSAAEKVVYWIDIHGKTLHRTDPRIPETDSFALPSRPGMIALRERGGLVMVLEDGLHAFDPASDALELLVPLEADDPDNRPNDGKCDAAGRLWVGTMNLIEEGRPTGVLYRIDPDLSVTRIARGLGIPNGLAWSPDDRVMFHADTGADVLWRYDYDPATGARGAETPFYRFDADRTGGVDGAAMDVEGGYWTALYGGSKLLRLRPDGGTDREIALPVSQPTMPAFGGAGMTTLFVTSAWQNLSGDQRRGEPLAGGLLAVETDVRGHPVHAFGG